VRLRPVVGGGRAGAAAQHRHQLARLQRAGVHGGGRPQRGLQRQRRQLRHPGEPAVGGAAVRFQPGDAVAAARGRAVRQPLAVGLRAGGRPQHGGAAAGGEGALVPLRRHLPARPLLFWLQPVGQPAQPGQLESGAAGDHGAAQPGLRAADGRLPPDAAAGGTLPHPAGLLAPGRERTLVHHGGGVHGAGGGGGGHDDAAVPGLCHLHRPLPRRLRLLGGAAHAGELHRGGAAHQGRHGHRGPELAVSALERDAAGPGGGVQHRGGDAVRGADRQPGHHARHRQPRLPGADRLHWRPAPAVDHAHRAVRVPERLLQQAGAGGPVQLQFGGELGGQQQHRLGGAEHAAGGAGQPHQWAGPGQTGAGGRRLGGGVPDHPQAAADRRSSASRC